MSVGSLTVSLFAMIGAFIVGIIFGMVGGKRLAQEETKATDGLLESMRSKEAALEGLVESLQDRNESSDELASTLRNAIGQYETAHGDLVRQRDRFAREAGYAMVRN